MDWGLYFIRIARKWFERFKKGVDNVEDFKRSLDETEPKMTIDEIAEKLNSSHETIYRHRTVPKLGKWVPHELSKKNSISVHFSIVL